jgi:hypothetical protein
MRTPARSVRVAAAAFAALAWAAAARGQEAAPAVEYSWDVVVDQDAARLDMTGTIRVRNDGAAPLERVPLVLYPNRFLRVDRAINDITFDRYYSPRFDPGRLDLRWVSDAGGRPLRVEAAPDEAGPVWEATAVDVVLAAPVPPGAWAEVHVAARLDVPSRLGTFGHRGRRLVLEGGWHPWVPARDARGARPRRGAPAMARQEVKLHVRPPADPDDVDPDDPDGLLLDGAPPPADTAVVETTTTTTLAVGPALTRLAHVSAQGDAPALTVYGDPDDRERADRIIRAAEQAAAYLRQYLPDGVDEPEVVFLPAPLRDRFVHATAGPVVLYSDRLFHVVRPLQPFHELEVGRATIAALVRAALRGAPLGQDRDWVVEALAWYVTRAWIDAGRRGGVTSGLITRGMGFFDFIPFVDSLLHAPRFVGSDLYYGRYFEPQDAVPDELARALSRRPRGRVVLEKLRDLFDAAKQPDGLDALVRAAFGRPPEAPGPGLGAGGLAATPLRARAAAALGRDLGPFFDLWLGPAPVEDLALDGIDHLGDTPDGGERVRVRIRRTGDSRPGEVGEPVTVETEGPDGQPVRVRWDGLGMQGEVLTTRYGTLFAPVELDPDGRVDQAYRGNDRSPALAKLLVNRFRVKLDLNRGNRNEAAVGVTLHPLYDYAHAVLLDGFYQQDERGGTLGYAYGFGTVIDERTYGSVVSGHVTVEDLTTGVLDGGVKETTGTLATVGAGLSFDSRVFNANPTFGFGAGFGYEHSDKLLGTDFRFDQFAGSLDLVWSIVRGTQVGFEAFLGQTIGTDIPTQRLFDAGGEGAVRGVKTSKFVDKATIVLRSEIRQMLVEDLDVPILWVAWMRKVQAAAFVDTGDVGPTIGDVFDRRGDWKWGAGVGLRVFLDVLGVTNAVVRFDLAFRLDGGRDELGPQYYLGAGQSF